MDNRKLVALFLIWIWIFFYAQYMMVPPAKPGKPVAKAVDGAKPGAEAKPADATTKEEGAPAKPAPDGAGKAAEAAPDAPPAKPELKPAPAPVAADPVPRQHLKLGMEGDAANPSRLVAELTNQGATIRRLHLPGYQNEKRNGSIVLLGSSLPDLAPDAPKADAAKADAAKVDAAKADAGEKEAATPVKPAAQDKPVPPAKSAAAGDPSVALSFRVWVDGDLSLATKNWEVVEATPTKAVFRTQALNDTLEVTKTFTLEPDSYMVGMQLGFRNLTAEPLPKPVIYHISGGVGLPIEGKEYTKFYRRVVALQINAAGSIDYQEQDVAALAANTKHDYSNELYPVRYAGTINQYFASVVIPKPDPNQTRYLAKVSPYVAERDKKIAYYSDVNVHLVSSPLTLAAAAVVTHDYDLFNGPKKKELLAGYADYHLSELIHYSNWFLFIWLPISSVAAGLLWVLDLFYVMTRDYGISIIMLTVLVRAVMFPLTYKQNLSMQKMQELAPKINDLKKKYGDDREAFGRAQLELFRKHNVNPLGGCLPMLIQMPIFIGLWQALTNEFALRHAPFLYGWTWIDDLSAPDQMFSFGITLPFGMGSYFNLLPILSAAQMYFQMKLMTPPATTPEQEMNQKIFKYLPFVMLFFFYTVPSGLCIYFITQAGFGLLERRFLPKPLHAAAPGTGKPGEDAKAAAKASGGERDNSWLTPRDKDGRKKKAKSAN